MEGDELEARRALQCAPRILLVRPARPADNPETRASNRFQQAGPARKDALSTRARAEFEGLLEALHRAGVETLVLDEPADDPLPDSQFPNNWFVSDPSGRLVLCPMQAPLRRRERRPAFVAAIQQAVGAVEVLDWSAEEQVGRCLEGTGVLVLDRIQRVAYAALSPRCDRGLFERWCESFGFEAICFETDFKGTPIYHTNVVLSIGARRALFVPEVCKDPEPVLERLRASGREVLRLSIPQMQAFAANALEVRRRGGGSAWVLSARALAALDGTQQAALRADGPLVSADLAAIETLGGGSARCMLAELWPWRDPAMARVP